jgi:hypothetical protein
MAMTNATGLLATSFHGSDGWDRFDAQMGQLARRLDGVPDTAATAAVAPAATRLPSTMDKVRDNEIRKARERIEGYTPSELRNLAAVKTRSGKPNPRHDPAVTRDSALAAHRMSGDDPWYDSRRGADDLPEDANVTPDV